MACCGGKRNKSRTIIKQVVEHKSSKTQKTVAIQRIHRTPKPGGQKRTATVQRQRVVPRQKCHHCGFPTMAVNIAGRERLQCSNPNCRVIIQ